MFLTVWLRRQEAEISKVLVFFHGMQNQLVGDNKNSIAAVQDYVQAVLPFAKGQKDESDKKMKEAMEKFVASGPIPFIPQFKSNPLADRAKQMRLPDDFKEKLSKRKTRKT